LDEVVVIGYATGSQRTISGAVQKVSQKDMNAGVVVNPLDALKGKVAGVNIRRPEETQLQEALFVYAVQLLFQGVMILWL
jgi:outer membrane receptor for Fe3+-dicitrate